MMRIEMSSQVLQLEVIGFSAREIPREALQNKSVV